MFPYPITPGHHFAAPRVFANRRRRLSRAGPRHGKPMLFIRDQPAYACFYTLNDCLADRRPKPGPLSADLARRQIRGILDVCSDGT